MTAFYMFRLIFLAFHGVPREHETESGHPVHESPRTMLIPLLVLAAFSFAGGWINWPEFLGGSDRFVHFLEPVMAVPHAVRELASKGPASPRGELRLMILSEAFVAFGIFLAWYFYVKRTEIPGAIARRLGAFHQAVWHGYYLNAFYNAVFVNGTKTLSLELGAFDRNVIDGIGVRGTARVARVLSRMSIWWDNSIVDGGVNLGATVVQVFGHITRYVQTGLVQAYMLFIVAGLIGFLGYYFYLASHAVR